MDFCFLPKVLSIDKVLGSSGETVRSERIAVYADKGFCCIPDRLYGGGTMRDYWS